MFVSFALAATLCLAVGTFIVFTLAARAGTDESIARVIYDAENPEKTR
jgi:hypothetical protein